MAGSYGQISSSNSASQTSVVQTPESELAMQIAGMAAAIGQQFYGWAQSTYQQTSQVTDQMVANFMAATQDGMSLANQALSQYENTVAPAINQMFTMASQYASPSRIDLNMGAAESDAAQAANNARLNTLANLESYGVDPSSGMYAELEQAANTAAGAAEAGAGQQAQLNTENTARQLLQNAVTQGAQLPGDVANSLNAAMQGVAGAENSVLSNMNAGTQAQAAPAPYFALASQLRNPPVVSQQNSRSGSMPAIRDPGNSQNKNNQNGNNGRYGQNTAGFNRPGVTPHTPGSAGNKLIPAPQTEPSGGYALDPAFNGPFSSSPYTDPNQFNDIPEAGALGQLQNDPFYQDFNQFNGNVNGYNPINPAAAGFNQEATQNPWGSIIDPTSTFTNGNFDSPGAINGGQFNNGGYGGQSAPAFSQPGNNGFDSGAANFGDMGNVAQGEQAAQTANQSQQPWWNNISQTGVDWNMNPYFNASGQDFSGQNYWAPGFDQTSGPAFDPSQAGFWGTPYSSAFGTGGGQSSFGDTFGTPSFDANGFDASGFGASSGTGFDTSSFNQSPSSFSYDPYSAGGGGQGWNTGLPGAGFNDGFGTGATPFNDYGGGDNFGAGGGGQGWNIGTGNGFDQSGTQTPANAGNGGGGDYSGFGGAYAGGFGGAYAKGGPIQGRRVPPQASPSRGARTDDVKANLNVGEFVMPRDVTQWYGQKFFQDLINKSRKARMTAPGGGRPSQPIAGPTRFRSAG